MPIDRDQDIILKRSGRRARLEITEDDLPPTTLTRRAASPAPIRSRQARQVPTAWLAVGVGTVAVVLIVVAALAIEGDGGRASKGAGRSLADARGPALQAIQVAGRATTLASIAASGRGAATAIPRLTSSEADIRQASPSARRDAALGVVLAERAVLRSLSELREVDTGYVAQPRLLRWKATRRRLVDARGNLARHASVAASLGLGTGAQRGLVPVAEVDRTLARLTRVIVGDHATLMRYQRHLIAYRRAKRAGRARGAKITDYGAQVRDVMAHYAAQRRDVATWVRETVPDYESSDTVKAHDAIGVFRAQRENTLVGLQDLEGAAPTDTLAAQARALEAPISISIQGLDFADQAVDEFGAADDPAMRLTDATSWHAFADNASDAASKDRDSAMAAFDAAIKQAASAEAGRNIPPRPRAPKL